MGVLLYLTNLKRNASHWIIVTKYAFSKRIKKRGRKKLYEAVIKTIKYW